MAENAPEKKSKGKQQAARTKKTDNKDRWSTWDKRIRDLVIWLIGIFAMVNELFLQDKPETSTLFFLAGILGLPFVLKADELRRKE